MRNSQAALATRRKAYPDQLDRASGRPVQGGTFLTILLAFCCGCGGNTRDAENLVEPNKAPLTSTDTKGSPAGTGASTSALDTPDSRADLKPVELGSDGDGSGSQAHSSCPREEPHPGDACSGEGTCTYGTSARVDCRKSYRCTGSWTDVSAPCDEPPTGYCPKEVPSASTVCEPTNYDGSTPSLGSGAECEYEGVVCYCYSCALAVFAGPDCDDQGVPHWTCIAPPKEEGCPPVAPNLGSSCSAPGAICDYGNHCDASGASRLCRNGIWEIAERPCEE